MRMRTAAVVVALAALAASGCGGGGGKTQRLSRDEYVTKADAICAQAATRQKALTTPASIAEIPDYVDKALPILDDAIAQIRKLQPPATMEKGVQSWLDKTQTERDQLVRLRTAAKGGDATKVRQVAAKGTQLDSEGNTLARAIGLTTCAST